MPLTADIVRPWNCMAILHRNMPRCAMVGRSSPMTSRSCLTDLLSMERGVLVPQPRIGQFARNLRPSLRDKVLAKQHISIKKLIDAGYNLRDRAAASCEVSMPRNPTTSLLSYSISMTMFPISNTGSVPRPIRDCSPSPGMHNLTMPQSLAQARPPLRLPFRLLHRAWV